MSPSISEASPMPNTTIDVRHIARLARLELDDQEAATFQPQLQAVLEHVNALAALDLDGIEPTAHPCETGSPLRDDVPGTSLDVAAVLGNAPDASQDQVRVPKVVADA